jgi:hypothetical protein
MEHEVERNDRRCRLLVDAEAGHVDRVDDMEVAMRPVTDRRRGTPVGLPAGVVPNVEGPRRKVAVPGRPGSTRQPGRPGTEPDDDPVPEPARRGRVGVEDGDHEARSVLREPGPGELRRDVPAGEGELARQPFAVRDVGAGHREGSYGGKQGVRVRGLGSVEVHCVPFTDRGRPGSPSEPGRPFLRT